MTAAGDSLRGIYHACGGWASSGTCTRPAKCRSADTAVETEVLYSSLHSYGPPFNDHPEMDVKKKRPSEKDLAKADERASERDSASIPLFFSIGLSSVLSAATRSGVPGGAIKARGRRKSAMGHGKKTPQFLAHPNRSTPQALDYSDSSPTHSLAMERDGFHRDCNSMSNLKPPYLINRCENIPDMFATHNVLSFISM